MTLCVAAIVEGAFADRTRERFLSCDTKGLARGSMLLYKQFLKKRIRMIFLLVESQIDVG